MRESSNGSPTGPAKALFAVSSEELLQSGRSALSTVYCPDFPFLQSWAEALSQPEVSNETLALCTITSLEFREATLGLFCNLRHVSRQTLQVYLLDLDGSSAGFFENLTGIHVQRLTLEALWSPRELEALSRRTLASVAYSSKARLLNYTLARTARPIFYCDSDLFFFRSPSNWLNQMPDASTLLFPHWNDCAENYRAHGHYNAGLIRVAPGSESFSSWWSDLCFSKCDQEHGFYDDQGYLDMAPILFRDVGVYRGGDENIGPWALQTLGVHYRGPGQLYTRTGKTLGSFHAASADPLRIFEAKTAWDQICLALLRPAAKPSASFVRQVVVQQGRYRPEFEAALLAETTLLRRFRKRDLQFTAGELPRWQYGKRSRVAMAYRSLYRLRETFLR